MDVITVLVVAILMNKSYSQTISLSPTCFSNGDKLTLNCDTPAVNQGIVFYQDGTNKGGCVPSVPVTCGSGLTQSGTTTSLEISSFNDATNSGNWTCEYGVTPSPVVIIAVNPCKSDENSNGKTLKIVAGVLGGVGGAGAAAGLVVGGSKLIKKQASVKNSEEDKSNKNSKEDESKKNSKEDKSKKDSKKRKSKNEKDKTDADNAEGGRSSAAADSTGVKADGKMERENLKNQNSAEENQKVEYINEERLKNTHSDKDTRKETNDAAAVAEDQITLISGNTS